MVEQAVLEARQTYLASLLARGLWPLTSAEPYLPSLRFRSRARGGILRCRVYLDPLRLSQPDRGAGASTAYCWLHRHDQCSPHARGVSVTLCSHPVWAFLDSNTFWAIFSTVRELSKGLHKMSSCHH